jgi:NAD(P)-dependent dehydrogenase (short-subunit alcohol dehydrogenase family)
MKKLEKKVAIVTGAGSGIGKAIAERFAAHGAQVVLADFRYENIEAVANEILRENGSAVCFAADISRAEDVEKLIAYAVERYGKLDVLVNNAGIMDDFTPAGETTEDLWKRVLETNLTGTFLTSKAALAIFLPQTSGNIINIASIGGLFGGRAGAAYTASKHGIIGLTKNIGYQYASKGIRCNAIAPGGVETNILVNAHPNAFGFDRMNAGAANITGTGLPEDIASIALFLASDESSFVNGSTITADGGWTAY